VANLKVTRIDSDTFAFVVTALATPSGRLYNPETAEKPKSTGKVYSKLFVVRSPLYASAFSFYPRAVSSGATLGLPSLLFPCDLGAKAVLKLFGRSDCI
jgi:hypothetical protein